MHELWVSTIAEVCPFKYVYPEFLDHISPIGITPDQITGKVLVIGQGSAFPEKTLLGTPESGFQKLRNEVETVYCCDTEFPSSPKTHLGIPCINTITFDHLPPPKPNTAYYELSSSYTFLQKAEHVFFDTVLMFRVVDTGKQIQELSLIQNVAPHVKKGGYFIFSGGRFPEIIPNNFFDPLTLIKSVRLNDFSDGFPFTHNMGVITQKKIRGRN